MTPWVVVPAPRSRTAELVAGVESLDHDPARVVMVTTCPAPVDPADVAHLGTLVLYEGTDVNISRWWNLGLGFAYDGEIRATGGRDPFEVLVMGSDVSGRPGSVEDLAAGMRARGLVMAGPDWGDQGDQTWTGRRRTVFTRVPGPCFMLAGEVGLRCDERFRWWYADDDLEMAARQAGPVGLVTGTGLVHEGDKPLDPEKEIFAAEDLDLYVRKWGVAPW